MSEIFDDMLAFMRAHRPAPPRALRCGVAAWDTLRTLAPADTGPVGLGVALGGQPLYGIPVHVDHAMSAGKWELREGEHVIRSGDIAPPGRPNAMYAPGVGFFELTLREGDL
jgi:hypothetical protein